MATEQRLLPGTALVHDRVAPAPAFAAPDGRACSPADFRHRSALVLCFLHSGCEPCRRYADALARRTADIEAAGARARAVAAGADGLALPVMIDRDGAGTRRLLGDDPGLPVVVVLDRYGAAWESWPATGHSFVDPAEVVATVEHMAVVCGECGD